MRKTKIICTIGPASNTEEKITELIKNGMNVARLNFSHGSHEEHQKVIDAIKSVRERLDVPVAIMLDSKGPEFRIGVFEEGKIYLKENDEFIFTTKDIPGTQNRVSVSYKGLVGDLALGDKILLNNGLMTFEVKELKEDEVICTVLTEGELSSRKSMSFPNKVMSMTYLSEQDKEDFLFGIKNDVDFIACSFVSQSQDIIDVREFLKANGGEDIDLIAKIENRSGVDRIVDIASVCEGVMIGRGDMGVEIPFEELPAIQKSLISTCTMMGKMVITATEMLESMIHNPRPTRAEISDVANAVYDGTSAIMLSGETAMGKHPIEAVATMSKIAEKTESSIEYKENFQKRAFQILNVIDAMSHSTCGVSIDIDAKLIVVCTRTGITARMVSRFRAPANILGMTTDEKVYRKLALSWGVIPKLSEEFNSTDVLFYHAIRYARLSGLTKKGDKIVITGGATNGVSGNTSLIKVETV